MKVLEKVKENYNKEMNLLKKNYKEIEKKLGLVKLIVKGKLLILTILFILSFDIKEYKNMRELYLIFIIINTALYKICTQKKVKVSANTLLYSSYAISLVFCISINRYLGIEYASLSMWFLMIIISLITLDKSYKIFVCNITIAISYLFIVSRKDDLYMGNEFINVLIVMSVALTLGREMRKIQLNNYELIRKSEIREFTDELTGLYNRRKLKDVFINTKNKSITAIAMIDIDKFKNFDDTYGHIEGDICLKNISKVFLMLSKKYPITFLRYGGEEFIVVFNNCNENKCIEICDAIHKEINNLKILNTYFNFKYVTISIGLACDEILKEEDKRYWIEKADLALYDAKKKGRNQIVVYRESKVEKQDLQIWQEVVIV